MNDAPKRRGYRPRRYIIFPRIQMKFALLHVSIVAAAFAGAAWTAFSVNRQIAELVQAVHDPLLSTQIQSLQERQLMLLAMVGFVTAAAIFGLSVLITHRFVGPIVALIRYFEEIRAGGPGRLKMRDHDALEPLAEYLRTVKIQVSEPVERGLGEEGMTLIEVMVSVFIVSIVMLGLASNMDIYQREMTKVQTKASRSDLSTNLRTQVKDTASLYNSAELPNAAALKNCLMGVGTTPCTHNATAEFVFAGSQRTEPVMVSATVPAVDAGGSPIFRAPAIGGTTATTCPASGSTAAHPVFYKVDGTRCACTDAPAVCPIQIISKYTIYCRSGATCTRPSGVRLAYDIKQRTDLPAGYSGAAFKTESGQYFFELNDEDYYIKTTYAASTEINPVTLEKLASVSYSVAEQEVKQGQTLMYRQPSIVDMSFAYLSPEDITRFKLSRYVYPNGCSTANLGTTVMVGSVSADCRPPTSAGFAFLKYVPTLAPRTGVVTTTDMLSTDRVVEYRIESLRADDTIIAAGRLPLRAAFAQDGYVNVTPPSPIRFVCSPAAGVNRFVFIVNSSNSGWQSINATVNPPLSFEGDTFTQLPGFSAINKNNPAAQELTVDPKYFTPGATYEITFTGVTGENQTRIDRKTFVAGTKPARTALFTTPFAGSKVRNANNLTTAVSLNLACGETPSDIAVNVTQNSPSEVLMTEQSIASGCVPAAGAIDENKFVCSKSFACTEWLGVATPDECLSKYSADAALTTKVTLNNVLYPQIVASTGFIAGAKVSAKLKPNSNRAVYFKSLPSYAPPTFTYVEVLFSSPLIAGETAPVKLVDAATLAETVFNCRTVATTNTTYASSVCTLKLTTPATSTVYNLVSGSPVVEIQAPSTFTVQILGEELLSCGVPPSTTTSCPVGKTLKRKFTTLNGVSGALPQDGNFDAIVSAGVPYTLSNATATVDVFSIYRPTSSVLSPTNMGVEFNFGLSASDNLISYAHPADIVACAGTDACASNYSHIPSSHYDSKRIYGTTFQFKSRAPVTALRDVMFARECYCE